MTIDVSAIAWMVRRMDSSATMKTFVATFTLIAVPFALFVFFASIAEIMAEGFFDMWEPDDTVFLVTGILAALLSFATPFLFIVWDWIARQIRRCPSDRDGF